MPDFSTITQSPDIRALVQDGILERSFHDALFPRLLFRGEATPVIWPANVGDSMVFTGAGLIKPKMKPLVPNTDPLPSSYTAEQWSAQIQQYGDSIDTAMPTSIVAIANLFLRNAQQLGLSAGMTMNRLVRNRMFNAAEAGWTVADGAQNSTTIRVKRLNGLTRARRPDLALGSPVQFALVSSNNPLSVRIFDQTGPAEVTRKITGFAADNAGDETGPGTITVDVAVNVLDRAYIIASTASFLVRVGGGNKVDDVGNTDLLTLAAIRSAVARFWLANVPEHPDGLFHAHLDPVAQAQVYGDAEFQRLMTSLPDYYVYAQFALGKLLNTVFFRNSENPLPETVADGTTAPNFTLDDPFAGELFNNGLTTGDRIHRTLFTGQGGIHEYYQDLNQLITEAGLTGRVAEPRITNNGIEVNSDRVQLILRSPQNRLQDMVATSWKFIGDFPVRTDVATGDGAAVKRFLVVQSGE